MSTLQALATGNRFQRWTNDESKTAGESVEINVWDDNSFDVYCQSETGMLKVAAKWQKSMKLDNLRTQYSANLGKWVVTVELK